MKDSDIDELIRRLKSKVLSLQEPVVSEIARVKRDPYKILISCLISLRTKDEVTREASKRLFELADDPQKMLSLTPETIEKAIYPAGFYHNKARIILDVSKKLVEEYDSHVPDTIDELLKFNGVGRKTANLVVTVGFEKPGICVDTHVHRISNRLGYVKTKTPEETEMRLRKKLPGKYWIEFNDLLVTWGQNICKPISPICSQCSVFDLCIRKRVNNYR